MSKRGSISVLLDASKPLTLNERQWDTLLGIAYLRYTHSRTVEGVNGYGQPMDFGGSNGSHHSSTATALARKGLVHRWKYGGYKGACWYRATDDAIAVLREKYPGVFSRYENMQASREKTEAYLSAVKGERDGCE